MARETFKLEGFRELERALAEDLPQTTSKGILTRLGKKAMKPVEDACRRFAPKDEGDLALSMRTEKVPKRQQTIDGIEIRTGPAPKDLATRNNAFFQEYGTVKMAANPYAAPAADAEGRNAIGLVRDGLADDIGKSKDRLARKLARQSKG